MILVSLLLAVGSAQHPEARAHPQDPLHHVVELVLGAEGAACEHLVDFEGTLHVWARSEEFDPRLSVAGPGLPSALSDEDSGGGTTAYLAVAVSAQQALALRVSGPAGAAGKVELHCIAAPESALTLEAAEEAGSELAVIERALQAEDLAGARARMDTHVETLLALEGGERSARICAALWDAGFLAYRLALLSTADRAWAAVQAERERCLPPEHPDLLAAKGNRAVTRRSLGDIQGALQLEEHVHAAWERIRAPDDSDLLRMKENLALTLRATGELERSYELLEYVHAARTRLLGPEHPDLLRVKANLAVSLKARGDLAGALELEEFVHRTWERLLPAEDPELLGAKLNLATTRKDLGDLRSAFELEEYVLGMRERLLLPGHPQLLAAQQNLAGTRRALGDLVGAHELFARVHAARAASLQPDHPDLLSAKLNLASALYALGDLWAAHELAAGVHALREGLLAPDHPDLLATKSTLAITARDLGDRASELELVEYVHEARERLLPADHPELLAAKQNLALTLAALGDFEGALELEELVHSTRERLLDAEHPLLLAAKLNLARTRRVHGDFEGALELEEHVCALQERLLSPEHPDLLLVKLNLAETRRDMGDLAGALELQREVHAVRERTLPAEHPMLLVAKLNLALTYYELDDASATLRVLRSLLHSLRARAAGLRLESSRVARSSALVELGRLSSALFLSRSEAAELARAAQAEFFETLEALRAVSTGSPEVAHALRRFPELAPLQARLAAVRANLSDRNQSPPAQLASLEDWRVGLLALADERDRLERELRLALVERDVPFEVSPSAHAVAEGLGEGAALISYFRFKTPGPLDPLTGRRTPAVDALLAFVVDSQGEVRRVELGSCARLEELVLRWRAALGKPIERGLSLSGAPDDELELGRSLRALLLDPCLAALGAELPAALHLVPDDFLHSVPLDALPMEDGRRLGEVLPIRFECSALRLARRAAPDALTGTLVALGGVDFDASGRGNSSTSLASAAPPSGTHPRGSAPRRFEGLVQSRLEVETLGLLYRELVRGEPLVWTKGEASKAALFESAPKARYLHVATHGWFAPETLRSVIDSLEEQSEQHGRFVRAAGTVHGFAPETLCGLALAGANRGADAGGKVPGILTAEELGTLDLSNCELAVLSACETNVGLRRAGQGIQSLQNALHAAGARTAITSLWRVDDAATRRLMELFYTKLWDEGLGKAAALWQAKMAVRAEGYPLRDWAAWILTGDPD